MSQHATGLKYLLRKYRQAKRDQNVLVAWACEEAILYRCAKMPGDDTSYALWNLAHYLGDLTDLYGRCVALLKEAAKGL